MYLSDFDQAIFDSVTPSDLGPVFTEYRNDPEGAIKRLLVEQTGDAKAVWTRPEIGPIDLIWGGNQFGLKKIAKKHPEALEKIPLLLKRGRLIRGDGGGKVFLVDDGNPVHVTVISLSYLGVAKAWILTSYDDTKGRASGILASVDTKKLDSAKMDCRLTVPMLVQILGHDMNSVNTFDNASPLSALERLKLIKRLRELRVEADGLGAGGAAAMRKLKIAKETREIRQKLGLGGNAATQEPQATGTFQSIAAGMPGMVSAVRPMDVPDGWVVMNAPRPLVGTQTMADGPMVAGRFWAAIDPNDPAAASYAEENSKNGAVVVVRASKSEQVEMALVGNEYADTYRKDYRGEELYKVLNPASALQGRTAGDLQGLLGQAKTAMAGKTPTPEPASGEQNPHVKALQDLAAGKNDSQGLEWMFNIIQGAIDGLEEVNQLTGDNEAAANAAITHWAEFEERLNG